LSFNAGDGSGTPGDRGELQIRKEGFLVKQGSLIPSWKKRWFRIQGDTLFYYKNQLDEVPKGSLADLQQCTVAALGEVPGRGSFCFGIFAPKRTLLLEAAAVEELKSWIAVIRRDEERTGAKKVSTFFHFFSCF
jgi:hypothetical protein